VLDGFPDSGQVLERAEVVYHEMEGWNESTTHAKRYEELPAKARAYVEFIEEYVGVSVRWIGTGPGREDMIDRQNAS
jgi:adenylosuccinate synthase